ncbi:MAG TPA: FliH/SctL family protein [Verrucomicrobiae bacterium]|nr:FliH/SctL family protein [Verrucomicrobiae bacterium]
MTSDEFVPLASFLRGVARDAVAVAEAHTAPEPSEEPPEPDDSESFEAVAQARRFRAALADALEVALETLLRDVASLVLARELQLRPADLRAIVAAALERYRGEEPVCVRVHPSEAAVLSDCGLRVAADAALRPGDALLEVRSGTIDASLGARLAAILEGAV